MWQAQSVPKRCAGFMDGSRNENFRRETFLIARANKYKRHFHHGFTLLSGIGLNRTQCADASPLRNATIPVLSKGAIAKPERVALAGS